jgi:hypothetical protein
MMSPKIASFILNISIGPPTKTVASSAGQLCTFMKNSLHKQSMPDSQSILKIIGDANSVYLRNALWIYNNIFCHIKKDAASPAESYAFSRSPGEYGCRRAKPFNAHHLIVNWNLRLLVSGLFCDQKQAAAHTPIPNS